MNVLINLLPDTRQAKIVAKRRRQMMTAVAVGVWAVCGGILVLLALYTASQKLLINQKTAEIKVKERQLQEIDGLVDALTAQQHSASLPTLYSQRVYLTKFFAAYAASNPKEVTLSSLTVDASNALAVNGTATSYAAAAKLARALEASNVSVGPDAKGSNQPYFTNVALQSASRSGGRVSFTLNAVLSTEVTHGK
jgi:Tfp pilus assembly protein PilN